MEWSTVLDDDQLLCLLTLPPCRHMCRTSRRVHLHMSNWSDRSIMSDVATSESVLFEPLFTWKLFSCGSELSMRVCHGMVWHKLLYLDNSSKYELQHYVINSLDDRSHCRNFSWWRRGSSRNWHRTLFLAPTKTFSRSWISKRSPLRACARTSL